MKVGELRTKLSKLNKGQVVKLAAEFYKLIPKKKRIDAGIDALVDNPDEGLRKATKNKSTTLSLDEIELDIENFLADAREQYYLAPNQVIPKRERPKWRFKVMKWYKELINLKRADKDAEKQVGLLSDLYELMCEACGYQYFSADDPFRSIGIEQTDFYKAVLDIREEAMGKTGLVDKGISLIMDNYLDRNTLYSDLMMVLVEKLSTPDLKYAAIDKSKQLLKDNGFDPEKRKKESFSFSSDSFYKKERNNNLTELIFRLHVQLDEHEEAIDFFKSHHYEHSEEIKLYVLIRTLFGYREKDYIIRELETAIENGIQPRENLLELLKHARTDGALPKYMH
ncbi:MAG: hypothetical protein H6558_21575 [Lewinellaceae bacterium]|nr:hypothetical protein [Lewinellaceae bacterium]